MARPSSPEVGTRQPRLWDAATGLPVGEAIKHQVGVTAVAFSLDSKTVVTGTLDGKAQLWDASTGQPIGKRMEHQNGIIEGAFSPDGRRVLTHTREAIDGDEMAEKDPDDGEDSVWLWDAASGLLLAKPLEHQRGVLELAFARGGKSILVRYIDGMARLWDAATGLQVGKPLEYDTWVSAVAFSPDGKSIVTGSRDSTARIWDAGTGRLIGRVMVHLAEVTSVAFSPDGKTVLTVIGAADPYERGKALLWDAATGRPVGKPMECANRIEAAVFSSDGKAVLSVDDDTGRVWDAATGQPIGKPMKYRGGVLAMALSPDGKTIVTGCSDRTARLWDAATGHPIGKSMEHRDAVIALAFSPDGRTIITGSEDNTARLWDAASGQPIGKAMKHRRDVRSVAFSPDGKAVATGSEDGTARVWDAVTGQPVGPPLAHDARLLTTVRPSDLGYSYEKPAHAVRVLGSNVMSVAFSPDGKTVFTGGTTGTTARLWAMPFQLPDDPPRLGAWVQTLTGLELDEQGVAHMLDSVGWRKCRDLLRRLGGPPLADSDQLLHPILFRQDPTALARARLERQRWEEIDGISYEVDRASPDDEFGWGKRIVALSAAGARGGLRRLVSDLLERFGETTDASTANSLAWYCVLAPDALVEPDAPVRLAEVAVKGFPVELKGSALNTLGAALYRVGRFEDAIRRLEEAIKLRNGADEPADWSFLAMAHYRLGHRDEARRWLDLLRNRQPSNAPNHFWDELELRLLQNEAEAVIVYDPIFPADPFDR